MVSGFTDDQQVREGNFADNWDLGPARADRDPHLIDAGVPSSSLAAAFGSEQWPRTPTPRARPRTAAWKSRRCLAGDPAKKPNE